MTGLLRRLRRAISAVDDPRARQLTAAVALLHQELGAGDQVTGVCVNVLSAGQHVSYGLYAGERDITRIVYDLADPAAVERAVGAMSRVITDATVTDAPP